MIQKDIMYLDGMKHITLGIYNKGNNIFKFTPYFIESCIDKESKNILRKLHILKVTLLSEKKI